MSGFFLDDADYAQQRRMQMASAMMGGGAHKGANGGLANLGSSLAGAYAMKNMDNWREGEKFANLRMQGAGLPPVSFGRPPLFFGLGGP